MNQVLARTTSRVFIGVPLCASVASEICIYADAMPVLGRDERYLSIVRKHVRDFMDTILTMNLIPTFLKPYVGSSSPLYFSDPTKQDTRATSKQGTWECGACSLHLSSHHREEEGIDERVRRRLAQQTGQFS